MLKQETLRDIFQLQTDRPDIRFFSNGNSVPDQKLMRAANTESRMKKAINEIQAHRIQALLQKPGDHSLMKRYKASRPLITMKKTSRIKHDASYNDRFRGPKQPQSPSYPNR